MNKKILQQLSFDFSTEILTFFENLPEYKKRMNLYKNILRLGTKIGAVIHREKNTASKKRYSKALSNSLFLCKKLKKTLKILWETKNITFFDYKFVSEKLAKLEYFLKTEKFNLCSKIKIKHIQIFGNLKIKKNQINK